MTTSFDVSRDLLQRINAKRQSPKDISGIPYGFTTLDAMTGGIQPNELAILGADTGAGKSLLLGQISVNVARFVKENYPDKVIRIIHCEMPLWQVQERLVAAIANVPARKLRSGRITDEEYARVRAASSELAVLPIEYLESPAGMADTDAFIRDGGNCVWWAVDHIQEHDLGFGNLNPLDHQAVALKAKAFANLAREVCSGLVLSQLVGDVGKREDHRPSKDDLYGGKMLQAPASLIMLLYQPHMYQALSADRKNDPKPAHLIIGKNRSGGELGDIKLSFNPARACFVDTGVKVKD